MSMKEKKELWKNEIIARLEKEQILGFIIDEVRDSLDYLNPYKMQNVYKNLNTLVSSLKDLTKNYSAKLTY